MDKKPMRAYIISWFLAPLIILACTHKIPTYCWIRRDGEMCPFGIVLYGTKWFFELPHYYQRENLVVIMILIFIVFLFRAMRGFICARLVWLGFLISFMYIFILYCLPIYYNSSSLFFIVYGFLFIITLFVLIEGVKSLDINAITQLFPQKMPRRITAAYLIFSIFILVPMLSTWIFGPLVNKNPVKLLDISLVVLLILIIILLYSSAFIMLIKENPRGYIMAIILLVWGTIPIITFMSFENMVRVHRYFDFNVFLEYHLDRDKAHAIEYSLWLAFRPLFDLSILFYHLSSYFFIVALCDKLNESNNKVVDNKKK